MSRISNLCVGGAVALAATLLASPALADKIITVSGGTLRGQIVKETARSVQLRDSRGLIVTVPRDEIEKIEKEDTLTVFQERLAKLAKRDADGFYALAKWAKKSGLSLQAKQCLEKAIAANGDHAKARKALGYEQVEGNWLRGDELKEALGLVRHKGKWVTPEQKAEREAQARSVPASAPRGEGSAAAAQPKVIVLPEEDAALLSIVRGNSGLPRRLEAMRTLSQKGGDAASALQAELRDMLAKAQKKLLGHFKSGKAKIRGKLASKIKQRRKAAWDVIFDTAKYPDANHGAAGQPLVDQVVGELYRAYTDPLAELRQEDDVAKLVTRLTQASGWLRQFCGEAISDEAVLSEAQAEIAKTIDMRAFPIDAEDAKALRASQEILRSNEVVKTSLAPEERDCILATNEYRMMFGLKALKAFEPLVRAARGHSDDMLQRGFFDHTSPVPGKRTPAVRCRAQGANFTGENIAMGMQSGRGAFNAWYTSSGHHRNMLGKGHRSIGIGQAGKYWTQNFGSDNP